MKSLVLSGCKKANAFSVAKTHFTNHISRSRDRLKDRPKMIEPRERRLEFAKCAALQSQPLSSFHSKVESRSSHRSPFVKGGDRQDVNTANSNHERVGYCHRPKLNEASSQRSLLSSTATMIEGNCE